MFTLRPFRNSDPPHLVEIWRAQPPLRCMMQPLSTHILEELVLSKVYFDRQGLIVAEQDGRAVGFIHAGFGPNADSSDISPDIGVICTLQTLPDRDSASLRHGLINAAEQYLIGRGAKTLYGGAFPPFTPFYRGLYGAAEMPGVLKSDQAFANSFETHGYVPAAQFHVMNCRLAELRVPVDRNQRQLSRDFQVHMQLDHEFDNWWESCTLGHSERSCFQVIEKRDPIRCGSVLWWDLEPLASSWGVTAVGMNKLEIDPSRRGQGLATFLVSQALRQLKTSGVAIAQVLVPTTNHPALQLFRKLGFEMVDTGTSYAKPGSAVLE